jgi:hypothetical protein
MRNLGADAEDLPIPIEICLSKELGDVPKVAIR